MVGVEKTIDEQNRTMNGGLFRKPSVHRRQDLVRALTRLNHILVPDTAADRDRLRQKRWVKFLGVSATIFHGFSREGRALWMLSFPIGLAGLNVRFAQVHLLFAMIVGLLLTSWLVRPLFKIKTLRSRVRCPARIVAHQPVLFRIELVNTGTQPLDNLQLVLPFLPWDGKWLDSTQGLASLPPNARGIIEAQATFQARGEHHLDRFQLGLLVPLGLTVGRLIKSDGARFIVVPPIANVTQITPDTQAASGHGSNFDSLDRGDAELGGVRPYRMGDPLKHLHARTWARTGRPHVREFVNERNDRVALVVLCSGPEQSERQQEAAISLAAGVASRLTLSAQGLDTLICDDARFRIQPRTGMAALDAALDRLATHQPHSSPQVTPTELHRLLRGATSVVLVTVGDPQKYASVVESLRTKAISCTWAHVGATDIDEEQVQGAHRIGVELIESGREIHL